MIEAGHGYKFPASFEAEPCGDRVVIGAEALPVPAVTLTAVHPQAQLRVDTEVAV
jgi:hypothetical protein